VAERYFEWFKLFKRFNRFAPFKPFEKNGLNFQVSKIRNRRRYPCGSPSAKKLWSVSASIESLLERLPVAPLNFEPRTTI
jgi:hypothetical protein